MPTRILIRLFFLAGLVAPLHAFALGVGQLDVRSALNQTFEAELPLVVNNPAELIGLAVRVPRQEDFNRAGVERLEFLSKLRFSVQTPPGGPSVVKMTSLEPIREPNFNLLLELVWPRGRLIREFTIQLDPELYANRRPPPPPPLPLVVTPPPVVAPPAAVAPAVPQLPPAPPVSFEGASFYGPVKPGETLMAVANRVRPSTAISLPQMMSILMAGNPTAFANGNPNALRTGATLKVPTPQALGVQGAPSVLAASASPELAATPPPTEPTVAPPPVVAPPSPAAVSAPETVSPPAPAKPSELPPATTPPPLPAIPPVAAPPPPAESPQEIVPQAAVPQTEGSPAPTAAVTPPPPEATAPTAVTPPPPEAAAPTAATPPPETAAPATATPPPPEAATPTTAKPLASPPDEAEPSWMSNPIIWLAIALIVLAIAAVILLPLLRRPARPKSSAVEVEVDALEYPDTAAVAAEPPVVSTTTQVQVREPRSVRPRPAAGLAAAAPATPGGVELKSGPVGVETPKVIEDLLKDFDVDLAGSGSPPVGAHQSAAPAPDLRAPLFEVEPPTATGTRRPVNSLAGTPAEPSEQEKESPSRLHAELPSELRLDGLDFDFGDFGLDKTARSQPSELPPLEMKPAVSGAKQPPKLPLLELGMAEPATEPPSLASSAAPPAAGPAMADLKFEFTDITQELARHGAQEDSLKLDEALQGIGSDTLKLGGKEQNSGGAFSGGMDAADYVETKLDLASAYLDMGDQVGARGLLEEVLREGSATQKERAEEFLKKLG